jgi:hypothetical protein
LNCLAFWSNNSTTRSYESTAFLNDLALYIDTLDSIHHKNDVNDTLNDALITTLELDIHAPVKTFKIKSRACPYVTIETKTLMKKRDTLHRIFLMTRKESDWYNYKLIRNQVKVILKQAEENYMKRNVLQHKNNSTSLWKIINRYIPSKSTPKPTYSKDPLTVANVRWPRRAMTVNTRRFFYHYTRRFFSSELHATFFQCNNYTRRFFQCNNYTRRFFNAIITRDVFSMQ